MYRSKNFAIIVCSVLAALFAFIGIYYYIAEANNRDVYLKLRDGELVTVTVSELSGVDYSDKHKEYKWKYSFTPKELLSSNPEENEKNKVETTTILSYTKESLERTDYKIQVRYYFDGEEKKENVVSRDAEYFDNSREPKITGAYFLFCFAGIFMILIIINVISYLIMRNVEKTGEFALGAFVEAFPSKFGSNRYLAIRYKFQDAEGEWHEAVTPYTFAPITVDKLKQLPTLTIRYKGNRSVIADRV